MAKPGAYTLVADSPTGGRASRAVTVVAGVDQPGLNLTLGTRTLTVTTTAGATVRVWPAGEQDLPSTRTATGGDGHVHRHARGALTVDGACRRQGAGDRDGVTANALTLTLPSRRRDRRAA